MLVRQRNQLRQFLACAAILQLTVVSTSAQDTSPKTIPLVPKVEPAEFARPSILPDRIVLTWADDPTTTQAVSWRTAVSVERGLAEIAIADAGPHLEANSKQIVAVTQPLTTDLNTAHFHTVKFEGLTPKTKYAYRVGDGVNWSEWFHFSTASTDPEPFSFIYFGDAQNDIRSKWSRVIREAYGDAPKAKFMIHAGDLINRAEADVEWQEWTDAGAWLNAMVPSIAIPGNHEQAKAEDNSRRISHHWRPQFAFPENGPEGLEESCYTLVYQGVRIIGLNSNEKTDIQAEWVDRILAENQQKWVICTFHHPIFSTGKDRDNASLRALWKPIFDKHHVDLILQGHDHTYGRTGLTTPMTLTPEENTSTGANTADSASGTVYVVSVSGPKMYNLQRHPFMSRHAEDTQLYQIIHIDGDKLHFEAFTCVGERYDAFTLEKQPGTINKLIEQVPNTPERLRPPVQEKPADRAAAAFGR
ncbi:MAG: metallophosphoesterase family protein [Planctomyces sp.]|nr:metallophosphoesterase family protein [Planctomyces sp.]